MASTAEDFNIGSEPPTTAFFHFSSTDPNSASSNEAVRALAVQLVHAHRMAKPTLSALGLLIKKTSGQQKASFDDAVAVLRLLLKQHSTFIIIDGLDECADYDLFLSLAFEFCQSSDCRIIILSRPTITIPMQYQNNVNELPHVLQLHESHNASDIESFITSNLDWMARQGLFGSNIHSLLSVGSEVSQRANGMFLWATLLMNYLRSAGLSPHERRSTLEQANLLEGLESLYGGMLNMLSRRFANEKRIAVDTFRWLSFSIKSLSIQALHTALAIIPGQPTAPDQYLIHFADSISRLTCALVEISNGRIRFIHRSVKEYLKSPACQPEFSLYDEAVVHAHLAARCLSYLAYDLPKHPLQKLDPYAGSSNVSLRTSRTTSTNGTNDSGYRSMSSSDSEAAAGKGRKKNTFDVNFPLLRYAALCWPVHLTRSLSSPTMTSPAVMNYHLQPFSGSHNAPRAIPWLPVLSHFLTDRLATTAWVEASWRYNLPPNISRLMPLVSTLKDTIPPNSNDGREIKWVFQGLKQLSEALNELRNDYGATLGQNPSLIWQWNIRSATEGTFWPVWDERRAAPQPMEF